MKLFIAAVATIYLALGTYRPVMEYYKQQAMQPKISVMKKQLEQNPEQVIKVLKSRPNDPKAQSILFKIYVGMHKYDLAYHVYQKLEQKHKITPELATLFVTIIPEIKQDNDFKMTKLKQLEKQVDPRLIYLFKAEVLIKQQKFQEAKKLLQISLSQIDNKDPAYPLIAKRIKNLPQFRNHSYQENS